MIIAFHGTKKGTHLADAAMVLTAALTMFERQKKVLMLVVSNAGEMKNIEMLADSYMKEQHDLNMTIGGDFEFEDTGIDALLRQASANRLTVEHFDNYVTKLSRSKNYLDIAPETTQQDFETSLEERPDELRLLLENAQDVYGYVFVLVNPKNEILTKRIDEVADKVVVAIPQGRGEELPESCYDANIKKKVHFLVEDYEEKSSYGYKTMKKSYDAKKFYVVPHNVLFRDAVNDGTLVQFAMRNYNASKTDVNYPLIKALRDLMNDIVLIDKDMPAEEEDTLFIKKPHEPVFPQHTLHEISAKIVNVAPDTSMKRGLFGKEKTSGKKIVFTDKDEDTTDENTASMQEDSFKEEPAATNMNTSEAVPADTAEPKPLSRKRKKLFGRKHSSEESFEVANSDSLKDTEEPNETPDLEYIDMSTREDAPSHMAVEESEKEVPTEAAETATEDAAADTENPENIENTENTEDAAGDTAVDAPVKEKKRGFFSRLFGKKDAPSETADVEVSETDANDMEGAESTVSTEETESSDNTMNM